MFRHDKFDTGRLKGKILDIGCGQFKLEGAIGLDWFDYPGVDVVADLDKPLPFEEGEFDVVYSNQVYEHISDLIKLITEVHRILKPGGFMVASVPYFRSSWAAIDPTHVRQFTINSLHYFVEGTLENANHEFTKTTFGTVEVYLDSNYGNNPFRWLFTRLALRWPYVFENSVLSFLFPFQTVTYVLTKPAN
ncbi:MAG: class I SAM-dependent methyltransferase [Rhizobiaceae bacterium]|nr:class I SAM-dependent methyltransferase [Rhizobiaceae bacterium]